MKQITGFIFLMIAASHFAFAQKKAASELIPYDPAFWRAELHLTGEQYRRMNEINHEFYTRLVVAYRDMHLDRPAFLQVFAQCWVNRNTQIWQAMNLRQRRKWKKMMTTIHADHQLTEALYNRL